MSTSTTPKVTLLGYDATHMLGLTLDNVVVDDITSANISASYANITLGPGSVNFTPSGTSVTVTQQGRRLVDAQRLHEQVGDFLAPSVASRSRQIGKGAGGCRAGGPRPCGAGVRSGRWPRHCCLVVAR